MRFAVLLQHQHRVKKLYPVFLRTAGPAVAVQCISSTKGPVRVHEEGHPSSSFGGVALEDLQRWVFFLHPKNNFSYGTLCGTHHGLPPLIKKCFFFFFEYYQGDVYVGWEGLCMGEGYSKSWHAWILLFGVDFKASKVFFSLKCVC